MRRLGVARAVVDGELVDGDVGVADGRIVAVGLDRRGTGTAAAGFVDLQVNGFAGVDLASAGPAGYATAGQRLAATGVTAYQPTFITADPSDTMSALARLEERTADAVVGPRILGAHVEGPFLSPERCGVHPRERLLEPDPELMMRLLDAGPVRTVTLAPELPGALDLITRLASAGVVVACGHSDADAEQAAAGFDAGARAVTHLFNAMRPLNHRDPGIVGVALSRDDVTVSLIVDGVHVAREAVVIAWRCAGRRLALVTDATAAAGMPDGSFSLGEVSVRKVGLEVRRADGTLAGSALTMDAAVRNAVDAGIDLVDALHAASAAPAALLGEASLGGIGPGCIADVVVLDDDLGVVRTLRSGTQIA